MAKRAVAREKALKMAGGDHEPFVPHYAHLNEGVRRFCSRWDSYLDDLYTSTKHPPEVRVDCFPKGLPGYEGMNVHCVHEHESLKEALAQLEKAKLRLAEAYEKARADLLRSAGHIEEENLWCGPAARFTRRA